MTLVTVAGGRFKHEWPGTHGSRPFWCSLTHIGHQSGAETPNYCNESPIKEVECIVMPAGHRSPATGHWKCLKLCIAPAIGRLLERSIAYLHKL